jgi:hypothetical protein
MSVVGLHRMKQFYETYAFISFVSSTMTQIQKLHELFENSSSE